MKECKGKNGCGESKSVNEFSKNNSSKDGLSIICKKCDSSKRKRFKILTGDDKRNHALKYKYGITFLEYKDMYDMQHGCCLICNNEYPSLVVDHNHKTGIIRGLLCSKCNTGIGLLKDSPEILDNAKKYLESKGHYG